MATEEMNVDERFKYLRMMRERYDKAEREGKARLLDEMQAMTGLHRKYLIACMNGSDLQRHERNRERSRVYGPDVHHAVRMVAEQESFEDNLAKKVEAELAELRQAHDEKVQQIRDAFGNLRQQVTNLEKVAGPKARLNPEQLGDEMLTGAVDKVRGKQA